MLRTALICGSLVVAFGLALDACCGQKLVEVPFDDAGSLSFGDVPDSGLVVSPKDAGVDAGQPHDAGQPDAGHASSSSGGTSSSGGYGGSGGSGSGGGSSSSGTVGYGGSGGSGSGGLGGDDAGEDAGTDEDAGSGPACAQDPDLTGDWTMTADYNMTVAVNAGGMPGLVQAFVDINSFLSTLAAFGVPVPQWATTLFGNLANLSQLFQDINVVSDLQIAPDGDPMTYSAQESWNSVSVMQNGVWVPLNSNVSFTSPPGYTITTCNGTATFSSHDLGASLAGVIPPMLDAVSYLSSCLPSDTGPCEPTFDDAVNAALDCSAYSGMAYLFCAGAAAGLETEIYNALNAIAFPYGVCTVEGTCDIQDVNDLVNGIWTGQLSGTPFPGTFSAVRN